jgi:hypothetical protein
MGRDSAGFGRALASAKSGLRVNRYRNALSTRSPLIPQQRPYSGHSGTSGLCPTADIHSQLRWPPTDAANGVQIFHFAFALSAMGTVSRSLRDLTMSCVVALYLLK